MVLQILNYVSENERVNIRQRQAEGIAAAKERGLHFGRPKKYTQEQFMAVYEKVKNHKISYKQAMWELDCCESTYYKMKKEFTKQPA